MIPLIVFYCFQIVIVILLMIMGTYDEDMHIFKTRKDFFIALIPFYVIVRSVYLAVKKLPK